MTAQGYALAISALRLQVVESLAFTLLPTDAYVLSSVRLIDRHNVNATDAAILAAFLDYRASQTPAELPAVLIASDHRLLRAAQSEGLPVLDPEVVAAADVPAFLAGL